MAPSERVSAAVVASIAAALGSVVVFDVYEDWLVQGNALATTALENAVPLVLVAALLSATVRLSRRHGSYLPTVARWTAAGVISVLALGGLVLGIQLVQGEVKPFVLAAHTAIGGAVGGLVVGYHVAAVRETRTRMRREKRRRESLFENAPTAIADVTVNPERAVVDATNDAFRDRFADDEPATGRPLAVVTPVDSLAGDRENAGEAADRSGAEDAVSPRTVTQSTPEDERYYTLRVVPYDTPEDDRRAYAIFTDITEERRSQQELEDAVAELERQNERLDRFVSVVSHDLRNPLSVAVGHLEVAREQDDSETLAAVDDALERMEELIADLLTLAREGGSATDPQPVDLANAARSSWETVDTADAALRVDTTETVLADPGRLRQLLENCFRNAVEHGATSPDSAAQRDDGTAQPGPRADDPLTVRVGDLDDGFYVEDDGPGIPEAKRDEVFEAGFTTDENGTGFGLTIVSEVARAHGWTVSVTDAEGPTDTDADSPEDSAMAADAGARFEIGNVDRA